MIKTFRLLVAHKRLVIGFLCVILSLSSAICSFLTENKADSIDGKKIMFVFDISRSTTIEDYRVRNAQISRLDMAKQTAKKIINIVPSKTRIAIAAFVGNFTDNETPKRNFMIFLPTREKKNCLADINGALNLIDWRNAWATGSDIYGLLDDLSLENFDEEINIIIFTDGGGTEIIHKEAPSLIRKLRDNSKINLILVGIGDTRTSLVPDFDDFGKKLPYPLKRDEDGKIFESKLEEPSLKILANNLGAEYKRLKSPSDAYKIIKNIKLHNFDDDGILSIQNILIMLALTFFLIYLII